MTAKIQTHAAPDWCHLCGLRTDTADVWWAENAEHNRGPVNQRSAVAGRRYLRACRECAERIALEADPRGPMRDCGLHPDATAEGCRSMFAGRPLCDLCAARAAVAMAREPVADAIRERDDARAERDHMVDMVARATALVMRLANALDGALNFLGPNVEDREEYRNAKARVLEGANAALTAAREWAR